MTGICRQTDEGMDMMNMNRHTILGLFLALSAVSCQLEMEDPESPTLSGIQYVDAVITAYQEGADGTRTVLTGVDLTTVNWCPRDAISVFSAGESVQMTTSIASNSATAAFSGTSRLPIPTTASWRRFLPSRRGRAIPSMTT